MIFLIIGVFYLAILGFYLFVNWRLFEKAGVEGWKAIIPIYNIFVMLQIVGKPWWWFFMFFIPLVNIIFAIWMVNMLSKSFGKDEGFTVGLILLGFIFLPILSLGDAQYQGPYGDAVAFKNYKNKNQFDFEKGELHN